MTTSPNRLIEMLREIVSALSRAQVPHAIAGGMAVAAHGHPRATRDIDFLVDQGHAAVVDEVLRSLGFATAADESADGFVRYERRPLPGLPEVVEWIDLLLARHAIGLGLIEQATGNPVQWQGIELPVVSAEGVVLMKLLSMTADRSRAQDRSDIIALLRIRGDAFDRGWVDSAAITLGERYGQAFRELAAEADAPALRPGPSAL